MLENKQIDLTKYSENDLLAVNEILKRYTEQLSMLNQSIENAGTPILKLLSKCGPALCWLDFSAPVQAIPEQYIDSLKQLETIGIVFRRNNKTFELRRQRLKQILQRESENTSVPFIWENLLASRLTEHLD